MLRSKMLMYVMTIALCVVALATSWLVFELRYVWYLQAEQSLVLRRGILLVAASILALWWLYPSRIAVVLLGLAGLFFPPLIDARFVGLTPEFLPGVALVLALLVGATQLRRMQLLNGDKRPLPARSGLRG